MSHRTVLLNVVQLTTGSMHRIYRKYHNAVIGAGEQIHNSGMYVCTQLLLLSYVITGLAVSESSGKR